MENYTQNGCLCQTEDGTCTSITSQYADVSMPVKLQPYAMVGNLLTECCGDPVISLQSNQNSNCGCGCEIMITQAICIRIPVEYGTTVDVGKTVVNCKRNPNCGCRPCK